MPSSIQGSCKAFVLLFKPSQNSNKRRKYFHLKRTQTTNTSSQSSYFASTVRMYDVAFLYIECDLVWVNTEKQFTELYVCKRKTKKNKCYSDIDRRIQKVCGVIFLSHCLTGFSPLPTLPRSIMVSLLLQQEVLAT